VKFENFSGNNLKSYVANDYLVLFHNYFWPRLSLDLIVLASASRFWPRLTSLEIGSFGRTQYSYHLSYLPVVSTRVQNLLILVTEQFLNGTST